MFGLERDQTLYVMCLASLQQDVGITCVHYVVFAPIQQPSLHSLEPLVPKVARIGLNLSKHSY